MLIPARARELVPGFGIRRVLPAMQRRHVGPFVFFDHLGPVRQAMGEGMDVKPHPHIGLATLTYLFEGAILHRDSLGSEARVVPGDVNWMIAGRGITHSERTPPDARAHEHALHGVQAWVALHTSEEEEPPRFVHHDATALPFAERDGARIRLVSGRAFGLAAPVETRTRTVYADVALAPGAALDLPDDVDELAFYVVSGAVETGGIAAGEGTMMIRDEAHPAPTLRATVEARLMVLGGDRLDGPRHIWWNFVSSRPERIEEAKRDWKAGRFPIVPGDALERIPLPER